MFKEIQIGEKTVPMLCPAAINIYCSRVFGVDPIKSMHGELTEAEGIDLWMKLGYLMAQFAECSEAGSFDGMNRLNEDTYLAWLCGIENGAYINALPEITELYTSANQAKSTAKKA